MKEKVSKANEKEGIMGREMILKKIEDGRTVSLEELKSAGFVLAADKSFGRVINKTHLKELKGSLKKDGCIEPVPYSWELNILRLILNVN